MSKERLEEIKDNYEFAILPKDMEWLIEQAERVPELEEHLRMSNRYVEKGREVNTRLEQQNKRYRDAFQDILVVLDWKTDNTSQLVKRLINKALEADK